MTDKNTWKISTENSLELFGKSNYKSRVRSPYNIAVIKDLVLGDFILEVDLSQSGREYGHRDLCLFFGISNSTNFYYVHIASVADEPRTKIAFKTTETRIKELHLFLFPKSRSIATVIPVISAIAFIRPKRV